MNTCNICGYKYKTGVAGEQGGLHAQDIREHNKIHGEQK